MIGTYGASFIYPGDSNYYNVALTNSSSTTSVSKIAPTVIVTANQGSATLGSTISFTATVTAPSGGTTPTNGAGFASWSITGVSGVTSCTSTGGPSGSSNVAIYTCSVVASKVGVYDATIIYPGDNNYLTASASTNNTTDTTVGKTTATVLVTANASTGLIGSSIAFTATVSGPTNGATPAGVGTWSVTGVPGITACTSTGGPTGSTNVATYTCSINATLAGTYGATFTFAADSNYFAITPTASISTTLVNLGTPTITVVPNSTSVALGSSYIITATVTPPNGGSLPTGAGTWTITGVTGVSCASTTGPTNGSGSISYTCTVVASVAGTYGSTFKYLGAARLSWASGSANEPLPSQTSSDHPPT